MFKTHNHNFRERIREHLTRQEFMKLIGCRLTVIEPGYVEAEIEIELRHEQQTGIVHGGVIATIADVAAGFAGFTLVRDDQQTVTVEMKTSFLRASRHGRLRAIGTVTKQGRSFHFCEADVFSIDADGNETLIARASTTMAITDLKVGHSR